MKARFIGNGKNDPDELVWSGVVFPRGEAVEVPDVLAAKMAGNSHFEVIGDEDDDGDVDRDDYRARADALGLDVDGRWGEARLKREIAKAEKRNGQE